MNPYKPLPQEKIESQKQDNKSIITYSVVIGIFIGMISLMFIINIDESGRFLTNETCQELINNSSILAYESGALYIINYTQSTGNILYRTNDGYLNQTSINEQCNYIYNSNEEVSDGR